MKNASQPINPIKTQNSYGNVTQLVGLTKREHFAAMAMQSLIATNPHYESLGYSTPTESALASDALSYADALLDQLAKHVGVNDSE